MKNKKLIRPLTSFALAKEIKIISADLGMKQKDLLPEHMKYYYKNKKEKINFKL